MHDSGLSLELVRRDGGAELVWTLGGAPALALPAPAVVEVADADRPTVSGVRHFGPYARASDDDGAIVAEADIETPCGRFRIADRWRRAADDAWRVDRRLEVSSAGRPSGVRLILELIPSLPRRAYEDFRYFAPPALYDLNDLNEDGIEDYLDTRSLHYREDRLNLLSILAYNESAGLAFSLARDGLPEFDSTPERAPGQRAFLQRTDIGSLGVEPIADGGVALVAAYPFAERTRSNALLVKERVPFAAYWPARPGEAFEASWLVRINPAEDAHAALWSMWRRRYEELRPRPVTLAVSHEEIARKRVEATLDFFVEERDAPFAAGFVTNCHPQDGKQISNVIQFGFTGQNNLNAFNLMRAADRDGDGERRRRAAKVFEFFVATASQSSLGLIPGFYNADTRRFGSWWTGLILPLAYAEPGADLEGLMGPLYRHLRDVIEALKDKEGGYLRCAVEEYAALLAAYRYEAGRGAERAHWLAAARAFGEFLVAVQAPDGSWARAYTLAGEPISEPAEWFGQTEVQQKSSTATPVAFLVSLSELTGEARFLDAARRAGEFVRRHFVDRMRFNGGIHDSIYAKPQLVDGESILFAMQALQSLHRATGSPEWLDGAAGAGRLAVTWICLWDVPLPPESTLARFGFRSTGWMACDAPGAGYIHP
ncbi:MAG: hypothetical protein JO288_07380, partial [Hyphomicrobiales bacterium]|nr:hypothetical protein [Hyphomicrobiales bacterium]